MSAVAGAPGVFRIDEHDWEQLGDTAASLSIDPLKNIVCYAIPLLGANGREIIEDELPQNGLILPNQRSAILNEVKLLQKIAGISRSIGVYTCLNHRFLSYGGIGSITKPIISIPHQHLVRPDGHFFTSGHEPEDIWSFSDDESRFFISREIAAIKGGNALLKLALKIVIIAAALLVYTFSLGWLINCGILLVVGIVYFGLERVLNRRLDRIGLEILSKRFEGDTKRAREAAIAALEKLAKQNIERRNHNKLCRLYISSKGENFLELGIPTIASRINALSIQA